LKIEAAQEREKKGGAKLTIPEDRLQKWVTFNTPIEELAHALKAMGRQLKDVFGYAKEKGGQ
jgi:hypothetical protein